MKNNIVKGSIVLLIALFFLISAIVVVSADGNETQQQDLSILTLSKGGITIQYPSDWGNSRSTSNYSVMAISKLDSIDAFGIGQVNIQVEKQALDQDFQTFLNESYTSMQKDTSFQLVSSGNVSIDNNPAMEYIYTSSDDSAAQKEHKAVWFEKGGQAYVIMYSAPLDQFEDNLYVFDYILSNIQIT